ncbi:MAG: hypothetical protein JNM42_17805 [Propionivibrio sp.]|mgnify:CR=1 FL=1|uniref:hypothetical protein n=1 Tax=Propionivibrio sp. TaxID=2212460 RepID=UPI001A4B3D08|nr:hypothetical protein [Propionivibrio sp.]MBL8416288.1 hypothetical protein [Propionivibrio sp.]
MLTDHLQREATDYEACNLLLQCFYLTERYELREQLAVTLMAQRTANDCFVNNRFLFRLLGADGRKFLENIVDSERSNPLKRLNYEVATETPRRWGNNGGPTLKSKLMFQDCRFGSIEKRKKVQSIFLDCGDGDVYSLHTPLMTLGEN